MKPLVKYRGGKAKEIPYILQHIPENYDRYIEPFFGGGALYFYLEPENSIINDINFKLISFYVGVKENFEVLKDELNEIEIIYSQNRADYEKLKSLNPNDRVIDNNEAFYYSLRDMYNNKSNKSYSDALLYYFLNKTAYSGMIRYNSKNEFNVPYGRYKNINTQLVTKEHHKLLQSTEILNVDYKEIFKISQPEDFMFLDPPYDCVFSDYGNEEFKDGFGELNHRELAEEFRKLECRALMVIGKTPLTMELYEDMIITEYPKSYSVNIRNRFKSESVHILVANY